MAIGGSGLTSNNNYFRMFVVIFAGIMTFGVLISWRSQVLFNAEYVEFPKHRTTSLADEIDGGTTPDEQDVKTQKTLKK